MTQSTHEIDNDVAVATAKPKLQEPPMYQVVIHNDDFTPMDFVVAILRGIYNMDEQKAIQVMLSVHQTGKGLCGIYTREVAETKVSQTMKLAKSEGHPLLCEAVSVSPAPKSGYGM